MSSTAPERERQLEYRTLGRTGQQVSAIRFGGAPAGVPNYLVDWDTAATNAQTSAERAVRRALARGITYFDTAPGYGGGISEAVIGRALGADRQRVFVATKTPGTHRTPAGVRESLESSLRLLQTDYVDLLQFHGGWYSDADVSTIIDSGCLDTYEQLRSEGKIRYLGFTSEAPNLAGQLDWSAAMLGFNLSHPQVDVAGVGMRSEEEVDRNADVADQELFRVDLAALQTEFPTHPAQ